jgi:hypothetical protein
VKLPLFEHGAVVWVGLRNEFAASNQTAAAAAAAKAVVSMFCTAGSGDKRKTQQLWSQKSAEALEAVAEAAAPQCKQERFKAVRIP